MNLLSKLLLLLLIINFKIIKIKSKLPDSFCACDKLNVDTINSRIYNGRDVKSNELKYVGSIYNRFFLGKNLTGNEDPYGYSGVCTAFLINAKHALTSADCVSYIKENINMQDTFLFALAAPFDHLIQKARKNASYYRPIEEIYIHPDFNEETGDNNIGVIRLLNPVILGPDIQAACLIDIRLTLFLEKLYSAGYGFERVSKITSSDSTFYENEPVKTMKVLSGLVTNKNCRKGKICFINAHSGTCPQDGGSPLIYNYEGRAVVVGINDRIDKLLHNHKKVSRKNDDYNKCIPNVATEFTHVGLYTNWIRNNFGDKCEAPDLIVNRKKLCKCKPISSKSSRGFNGTIIKNKNDLTYNAHLFQIIYENFNQPPFYYGQRKIYKPFCSAFLVNSRWIITAAHCIWFFNLDKKILESYKEENFDKKFQVGVSLHNLNELYKNPMYMSTIKSIHNHPLYNGSKASENDISLVETDKEFNLFKLEIYPPCLLDFDKYNYGNDVLIQSGFGIDAYTKVRPIPKSLIHEYRIDARVLDLRVTKNYQTDCPEVLGNSKKKFICFKGTYQSPCYGDSGGPLIARDKEKNKEYIIAEHSSLFPGQYNETYIANCLPKGIKLGVYLYEKMDFIKSIIGLNYCSASTELL